MKEFTIQRLADSLSEGATVLRRSDDAFPAMNQLWNSYHDVVEPNYIVMAQTVADIVHAVNFARINHIDITPRAGRHNLAGLSSVHEGLVVDLRRMTRISVNTEARTLTAEGGLKFAAIDDYLWQHHPGFCIQAGMDPSIGLYGAHLGVGHGWRQRQFGTGTDNIVEVKMVLADGSRVTANSRENPDLFFAVRGAGPNFGIVYELTTKLHPIDPQQGPEVRQGLVWWPLDKGEAVFQALVQASRAADFPDSLMWVPELIYVAEQPAFRLSHVHYADGDPAQARVWEGVVKDLMHAHGGREVLPWSWVTHLAVQKEFVNLPARQPWYTSAGFAEADQVMEVYRVLADKYASVPNTRSSLLLIPYGGALARRDPSQTANPAGPQNIEWLFMFWASWENRADADGRAVIRWTRETFAAMRDKLRYGYPNGVAFDQTNTEYARFVYGDNYDRLAAIKRRYDPDNLFHHNINIAPAATR